jgi:hypothetical protein
MHSSDFRKIDLVCSDDENRPELQCVYLHEGHLYAADGYIAARLPVTLDEADTDGAIPARAIEMARETHSILATGKQVTVVQQECHYDRPEYDRAQEIIDTVDRLIVRPGIRPNVHNPIISLDARRLWTLAQAICSEGYYYIDIYPGESPRDPVIVTSREKEHEVLGVIMPAHRSLDNSKIDPWYVLDQLKAAIAGNDDTVELGGETLRELREVFGVE